MTGPTADKLDVNNKNSSSWLRAWLSKPALQTLSGLLVLGLAVGSAAHADDTPWRGPAADPDVLPPNLPISPLAPRPGDSPSRAPDWQSRPGDNPTWLPGRPAPAPMKPAPVLLPQKKPVPQPELLPMPRLVEPVQVVQAVKPSEQVKMHEPVKLPVPVIPVEPVKPLEIPTVAVMPIPPDKPSELPKVIPPAIDDLDPKPKAPVKLGPPREMEPKKLPPVDLTTPRTQAPTQNNVWGATVPHDAVQAGNQEVPPSTVPNKHGTFGSPNLTISRDRQLLDLFRPAYFFDDDQSLLPDYAPALDRSFVQAENLLWWVNAGNIPVLAAAGTGTQSFGYLGQPGTDVLLGPGSYGATARNGFRTRAGTLWQTPFGERGVDGSFFFLGKRSTTSQFDSSQYPTISRPFFAPNLNSEFAQLVAFPGLSTGTLSIEQDSLLWGADANYRIAGCRTCDSQSEWFAGYRFLSLEESLGITEYIVAGPNAPDPVGTSIIVTDAFETRNQFHGAQIGWAGGRRSGRWSWDARFSVALGVTHQQLDIRGDQWVQRPGQSPAFFNTGGLLAAGPNVGSFSQNRFSVVPEATFNVGYAVYPGVRAYVGYNFMYWSNVLRPGDQIDRVVDLSFVPNGPGLPFKTRRPLPTFTQSNLWAQGVQFGVEARW